MIIFLLVSIVSIIFVLWWGIKSLKQQKQVYDQNIVRDTLTNILDEDSCYCGRKVETIPATVFCGASGSYKTCIIKLLLNRKTNLNIFQKWFLMQRYAFWTTIRLLDDCVVFTFPAWPQNPRDERYIRNIVEKMSFLADKLENNYKNN